MRHAAYCTAAVTLAAGLAPAALVVERWGGPDAPCPHAGTLAVQRDGAGVRLSFDLSALPPEAAIRHASLLCFTEGSAQPRTMPRIVPAGAGAKAGPLALEPPLYRSFDATAALRAWAEARAGRFELAAERFDGLLADRTVLEIRYDGRPGKRPEQVTGLRAVHHDGQTFLVWRELPALRPRAEEVVWVERFARKGNQLAKEPGPGWMDMPRVPAITLATLRQLQGLELRDKPSGFQGIKEARQVRRLPEVRYRVYRHDRPITAGNLAEAALVGEGRPLSAYDQKMAVIDFQGEYINQREVGGSIIPVSCIEDGKPVEAGEAIYVHTPAAGRAWYAVTAMVDGAENAAEIGPGCSLAEGVVEMSAPPRPVLQRLQAAYEGAKVVERWYLAWPAPPYANLAREPLHVLVGQPQGAPPWPMIVDGFHGGFNIVEAMRVPASDALTLLIEHQTDWGGDGDLLYNEGRDTLRPLEETRCDRFSERYLLRMVQWAMGTWSIDRGRVFAGQHDSGPLHFAVRHPELFGRIFLGGYTASYVYGWSPPSNGLPRILGPRELARTPEGHRAWDVLDLGWFLRQDPSRDIPFVMGFSGTGKDRGHTSEFGWQDDPRGWAALRDARQPFIAAWSTGGDDPGGYQNVHSVQPEAARMLQRIRWDATIPAFSRCSLDNNPGNGDPADGDSCGQINGYLIWDNTEAVDAPDAWEMTIWLVDTSPEGRCTVDVTPRHCRQFRPKGGESFQWTAVSPANGKVLAAGQVVADKWGLVTIAGLAVTKDKLRLRLARQAEGSKAR